MVSDCHYAISECHYTIFDCHYAVAECHYTIPGCPYTAAECHYIISECHYAVARCPCTVSKCHSMISKCHYTVSNTGSKSYNIPVIASRSERSVLQPVLDVGQSRVQAKGGEAISPKSANNCLNETTGKSPPGDCFARWGALTRNDT